MSTSTPSFALAPQYDPREVEARLYQRWLAANAFTVSADSPKPPYVIVIPPPNVTAVLHVGHGMNNVIQDVVIRFERMRGRGAEWLPGTDHAGIATQNVVEKLVAAEGKTRFDLGRERFVERTWAFVRETGGVILEQLKTIGCSCDWSRTVFTLDPEYSQAVREAFVRLWEEKRIYRGHRVIHWCPHCLTSLSDEEAEFAEETGKLYHIRYRVDGGPQPFLTVATTRPETMLGDTAIAAHPDDPRHAGFIGKTAHIPITDIAIPIIGDEAVDPKFGTGFVKVTPAHDANDFEIGMRHKLPMPIVMTADGKMGEDGGGRGKTGEERVPAALRGVDRFEARDRIVKQLKQDGLLDKVEPHPHAVRHCYRCDTVVEPRLSDQWFVAMKDLAKPALAAYQDGSVRFVPERWGATYEHWMANIRDWNISRQLWWGHRIPVFTCGKCGHVWAARQDPTVCPKCGDKKLTQDPDVLDTWFSSWLWPFAAFGWPEQTPDLKHFYPGNTLVTAPEILFFWVARMIMSGLHFMKALPFTTVYLHGTVRDTQHRKMSKSLGNGIDPLDVVRLYGADALRWTLIAGSSLGADLVLDPTDLETTFAPGRNFANKLWNIGRFVLGQLSGESVPFEQIDHHTLALEDRWILSRLQSTVRDVTASFTQFRLDEGAKRCFDYVWKELADWYVEAVKPRLAAAASPSAAAQRAPAASGDATAAHAVLTYCFDTALRLLHPVVPFITEELWQKLPGRKPGELLTLASWPSKRIELVDERLERQFAHVQGAIVASRNIRAEYKVPPKVRLPFYVNPGTSEIRATLNAAQHMIRVMSGSNEVILGPPPPDTAGGNAVLAEGTTAFVPLDGTIDIQQECKRLSTERTRLDQQLERLTAKLSNENFVARAPAEVVAREREKEREWRFQRDALDGKLKSLGCS
jgi:valyl-tRNA synthetase